MSLFNKIKNKVSEGIAKGIGDAVSKAAESTLAPVAEKITNKLAEQLNEATETVEAVEKETKSSSFQDALNRLEKAAENCESTMMSKATEQMYQTYLINFPKWTYSTIRDVDTGDDEEYIWVNIFAEFTDDTIESYQNELKEKGFTGNFQIMKKIIEGREHVVNFTDVVDGQIQYLIYK